MKLSLRHPGLVRSFVGIHPSEAEKEPSSDWLGSFLSKATGVGEVGLDPKYSSVGKGSAQFEVFHAQLALAEEAEKPVEVHSREAESKVLEALGGYKLKKVLLHWFQSEELMARLAQRGYFVSFGPALLTSKKLQRMASKADLSSILTETDGPVSFRALGGGSGPCLIPSVVYKLAEVRGIRFEDMRETVLDNSLRFLGASEKG